MPMNRRQERQIKPTSGTLAAIVGFACFAFSGCDVQTAPTKGHAGPEQGHATRTETADLEQGESWDALFLGGSKVGHIHTVAQATTWQDGPAVRTDAHSSMRVRRFDTEMEIILRSSTVQRPNGEVVAVEYVMDAPGGERGFNGRVENEVLRYQVTAGGQTKTQELPWPMGTGGPFAVEQSLRRHPITAGQQRSLKSFEPILDQLALWQLAAEDWEDVQLLSGTFRLLRVRARQTLPDATTLDQTLWVDRDGEVLKSHTNAMNMEMYRTTRKIATAQGGTAEFDLGFDVVAKVDRPVPGGHKTRYAVYELTLDEGDPTAVFASGGSQEVRSTGANTAEVTVRAVRPGDSTASNGDAKAPSEADLSPCSLIQSDDPQIVEMAGSVAADLADPWTVATALEQTVRQHVTRKNYSQMFASAAEVAKSREGDCTEHAVLLAALCRARDIPARVAMGLVYSAPSGGFLYHMWNEVWIDGRWIPLDATLGLGGIGAAHLKVSDSNLHGSSAYSSFLPILQVVGQLQVKVMETR